MLKNLRRLCFLAFTAFLLSNRAMAVPGDTIKVLFLGNSFTHYYSLTNTIRQIAASAGKTFTVSQSAIDGYRLRQHWTNTTSMNLLQNQSWDYVVLQEQSTFNPADNGEYYIKKMDSINRRSCGKTLLYLTWGYPNATAYPPGQG
jgi:hypothetical protein